MAWYVDWICFARVGTSDFFIMKKSNESVWSVKGGEFLKVADRLLASQGLRSIVIIRCKA